MTATNNSYLTFAIGDKIFGINVSKVLEIREFEQPKSMPDARVYMLGVIEHDSEVIPLIDARVKFGMESKDVDESTVIVVLQLINHVITKSYRLALVVDSVSDVKEVENSKLKQISDDYKPNYIHASFNLDDTFVYLLDPDVIFDDKEVVSMLDTINEIEKSK